MNYREIFHFIVSAGRVLFFSMVTAPAVVLFVIVLLLAGRGSLTGWYIDDARGLVGNAPAGMVMDCISEKPSPSLSEGVPPPSVNPEPCTKTPVDAARYAALADSTLLAMWKLVAIVALGFRAICWALSDNPSKLSNIVFRKKRDVTHCNHDR